MSFAYAGAAALEYAPCSYGASKLLFRGPRAATDGHYCAVLGGTEAYGRFIPDPWPALVAQETGEGMVNLGALNAGPDLYLGDPAILDVARGAAVTVLQIPGAANLSNRLYTVHPRRNDRFTGASAWLRTLYRDVDFTEIHFTRHLLRTLHDASAERFAVVAEELREAWTARMTTLIAALGGRVILLWMGEQAPPAEMRIDAGRDPWMVTASMVGAVASGARSYLEVIASDAARAEGVEAMAFSDLERTAAGEVPGPRAHREVARAVAERLRETARG